MSLKITKSSIESDSPLNLLDFSINTSGFTEEFTNSNCIPATTTRSTFNIQECTVLNCTTVNCTTVNCTTINCTTIKCLDADTYTNDNHCNNDA